jgi:two-component system nitrogen regulation response regulator GlnG
MHTLLVIDDDLLVVKCFRHVFPPDEVTIRTCPTAAEAVHAFRDHRPDAVLCDVRLPDRSGLDVLAELRAIDPKVPVILMTGYGTSETAIEAMRRGAYDYLLKPLDPDQLEDLVHRAFAVGRLMRVPTKVTAGDHPTDGPEDPFLGTSPPMQEVFKAIGRVASTDATVLVRGESGTGKELVARAIYQHSRRADKSFLAVNCAAIPETLLESELFGHEKGAFTGAERKRIGKFEQCHGGTLFLDEIGDMTPLTQSKVLRVLQDGQFERVGGSETIRSDVRVIAATHRDLEGMIAAGTFREDLFYRLNVCAIRVPPLRERGDDLPLLVNHFVRRFGREFGKAVTGVAEDAMAALRAYPWPGNVRQLQSVVKQALLKAVGPVLTTDALPGEVRHDPIAPAAAGPPESDESDTLRFIRRRLTEGGSNLYAELTERVERELLTEVLRHTHGNITRAAVILGITRPTLRAKLAHLGLVVEHAANVTQPTP